MIKDNTIKAIAIDDEPLALEIIKDFAARIEGLEVLAIFDNAIKGRACLEEQQPDLLFVDIDMPDISGIELVSSLQHKPAIVFTTAYKEFALDGFELEAADYLLKPFSFERFEKAVQKVRSMLQLKNQRSKEDHALFVFSEYRKVKIPAADIIFIESMDDYIKIHLENSKPVLTLLPMKKALEALPANSFARIHRRFIVSLEHIRSVLARKVMLTNGAELPVSETYAEPLNKKLKNH